MFIYRFVDDDFLVQACRADVRVHHNTTSSGLITSVCLTKSKHNTTYTCMTSLKADKEIGIENVLSSPFSILAVLLKKQCIFIKLQLNYLWKVSKSIEKAGEKHRRCIQKHWNVISWSKHAWPTCESITNTTSSGLIASSCWPSSKYDMHQLQPVHTCSRPVCFPRPRQFNLRIEPRR